MKNRFALPSQIEIGVDLLPPDRSPRRQTAAEVVDLLRRSGLDCQLVMPDIKRVQPMRTVH